MSRTLHIGLVAAVLVVPTLVLPHAVYAYGIGAATQTPSVVDVLKFYVDPGAAGFIIVSVLGFISAIGYTFRTYIGRMKRLVLGDRRRTAQEKPER